MNMDLRPLGGTGLEVSEIGISLPDDAALAETLGRRALQEGVRFFLAPSPAVNAVLRDLVRDVRGAVVAYGPRNGAWMLQAPGGRTDLGLVVGGADELPADDGWACVLAAYSLADQHLGTKMFPAVRKRDRGVVAVRVLHGGALAGTVAHAPPGSAALKFKQLVKPKRTLAQAAILFALASQYVSSAVVRVSSVAHLMETVDALGAEPLTMGELEFIFEMYANRHDSH